MQLTYNTLEPLSRAEQYYYLLELFNGVVSAYQQLIDSVTIACVSISMAGRNPQRLESMYPLCKRHI
jgi:hypothetical protein